jgi:hypothetical protein
MLSPKVFTALASPLTKGSGCVQDGPEGRDTPEAIHTFLPITRILKPETREGRTVKVK